VRVVVVGARGQLGAAITETFAAGHDVTPLGHADLDATDDRAVENAIERLRPEVVVNCAAYNNVDGAEDHPIDALNLNAFAVRALARAASARGIVLVHFGTDFVFDGTASAPYTEEDRPNPRSVYAASKLLGEWFAADAERSYVLRVESLFGRAENGPSRGTIAGFWKKLVAGESVRIFYDRTISPTFVADAAHATLELVNGKAPYGLYHCVNSGCCTWLELATELARQAGVQPRFVPVRMADVPLRAQRPQFCALSNSKLLGSGITMPTWQDAVRRFVMAEQLGELGHKNPNR
jgi:dTDP-4-dehydrorhamnose reductase